MGAIESCVFSRECGCGQLLNMCPSYGVFATVPLFSRRKKVVETNFLFVNCDFIQWLLEKCALVGGKICIFMHYAGSKWTKKQNLSCFCLFYSIFYGVSTVYQWGNRFKI